VQIGILGPLEVQRDGHVLTAFGRRVAAVLARPALDCGRLVSAPALIDTSPRLPPTPVRPMRSPPTGASAGAWTTSSGGPGAGAAGGPGGRRPTLYLVKPGSGIVTHTFTPDRTLTCP